MRKLALASLAAGAIATSFSVPAVQASPPVDGPDGARCAYTATSDPAPGAGDDDMTGEVHAGPLAWDRPFTVHCSLQRNDNVHNGPSNDLWRESQAAQGNDARVAYMAPRSVNYTSGENDQEYLCTSVTHGGGTLYWVGVADPDGIPASGDETGGYWTTYSSRTCSEATQAGTGPTCDLVDDLMVLPPGVEACRTSGLSTH